jgi:hypothetical protein
MADMKVRTTSTMLVSPIQSSDTYADPRSSHRRPRAASGKGRKRSDFSRAREASPRQCKYVSGILARKSKLQAALDAGYSRSTAENAKQKIESKPAVTTLFREILEAAGIADHLLGTRISEGLDAMTVLRPTKYDGGLTVPNFPERRRTVELVLKLKGLLPAGWRTPERGRKRSIEKMLTEPAPANVNPP